MIQTKMLHTVTWDFGFCFMFMFSCLLFLSLVMVLVLSCDSLVCVLYYDWFFGSCVMFSLAVLVMCPVFHWLALVMWPVLFDINSPHVAIVSCRVLNCVTCCWCVCVSVHVKSLQVFVCIMDYFWIKAWVHPNSPSVDCSLHIHSVGKVTLKM